ncbi:nucleoside triphosphate pyrophosphohydrolase [Candidatus Woesebacteria bacterium]|nr:MAG: nucleoside triphosphate pyrophosphohydrolase [Candidatus Woesebacteria bacterium]
MRKFEFKKLVRDKIVEGIIAVGNKPNWKTLSDSEFVHELKKKIVEEALEVPRTNDPAEVVKELADIQEIIDNLLEALKISKEKFAEVQKKKNEDRGSFKKRQYIDTVETSDEVTKWVSYYLDNPDKYPEVKDVK